jgi:hypothetical protein
MFEVLAWVGNVWGISMVLKCLRCSQSFEMFEAFWSVWNLGSVWVLSQALKSSRCQQGCETCEVLAQLWNVWGVSIAMNLFCHHFNFWLRCALLLLQRCTACYYSLFVSILGECISEWQNLCFETLKMLARLWNVWDISKAVKKDVGDALKCFRC